MTEKITSLLEKLSLYEGYSNSSASSNQTESQNSKKMTLSTVDEDYFHIKLRRLFKSPVENSFRNVEIKLINFFEDVKIFLVWVVEQKGIDKKKSNDMIKKIEARLKALEKIELDSFFINVPGENIYQFFDNMKSYSYPYTEEKKENFADKSFTIIIESTHSLRSAISKKPSQIHKYHLFFTMLNEYFKKDDKYLGKFHELFFQKYCRKVPSAFNKIELKNENNFPFSDNFIVIVASDHSFKVFKETREKIFSSNEPNYLSKNGKYPKIYEKGEKNYQDEDDKNETIKLSDSQQIKENYNYFKYIINEVNNDNNWICKIIYFDLYVSLIVPKCEIKEGLTSINESIRALENNISQLNESNSVLEKKNNLLEESVNKLQNQNNKIFEFLKEKFPDMDLSAFK